MHGPSGGCAFQQRGPVTRRPRVSGPEVIAALERLGFQRIRQRGSHVHLRRPGRPDLVTVPFHRGQELPLRTLRTLLRQAGLTADELRDAL